MSKNGKSCFGIEKTCFFVYAIPDRICLVFNVIVMLSPKITYFLDIFSGRTPEGGWTSFWTFFRNKKFFTQCPVYVNHPLRNNQTFVNLTRLWIRWLQNQNMSTIQNNLMVSLRTCLKVDPSKGLG